MSKSETPRFEVIESRVWRSKDGREASIYGAVPHRSEAERIAQGWRVVTRGWTVRDNDAGTVGCGRRPWDNREDAQAHADTANARFAK